MVIKAQGVVELMTERGVVPTLSRKTKAPDVVTYSTLIDGLSKALRQTSASI